MSEVKDIMGICFVFFFRAEGLETCLISYEFLDNSVFCVRRVSTATR